MKGCIDTLVRIWVQSDRGYIEDTYPTIEKYLLSIMRNEIFWQFEFFEDEEIDKMSDEEMEDELREFAKGYAISPAELFK